MTTLRGPSSEFWSQRRVLVTGHTGFKGAWLSTWLADLGASVMGVSLEPLPSDPCLWALLNDKKVVDVRANLADGEWQTAVTDFDPHVVLHLAAQSLVPKGYANPLETFTWNVLGTAHLMDLLPRLQSLQATLVVTTDKVYDTRQESPFSEDSFLGGQDPYSASKAAAELLVHSWPTEQLVATARAGNVIGGGDWAEKRLLPDLDRAWKSGRPLRLRRPRSVRPWQHVLEPLRGYLMYVEGLVQGQTKASALNFGPSVDQCVAVEDLVAYAAGVWAESTGVTPAWEAIPEPPIHETDVLELDSTRAMTDLGWSNVLDWRASVTMTIEWNARLRDGENADDLVASQLASFLSRIPGTAP